MTIFQGDLEIDTDATKDEGRSSAELPGTGLRLRLGHSRRQMDSGADVQQGAEPEEMDLEEEGAAAGAPEGVQGSQYYQCTVVRLIWSCRNTSSVMLLS